jgi:nickel-type superoxide dismutase maturation protease
MRWPLVRVAVAERSMEPALQPGDWLLVWRGLRRRPPRIRPGQLVIARHPVRADLLLVKRAAAHWPGGWWLESDNSAAAGVVDSRSFGPVPEGLIEGFVLGRYWRARTR